MRTTDSPKVDPTSLPSLPVEVGTGGGLSHQAGETSREQSSY